MIEKQNKSNLFSWSRLRTTEELGDFVSRKLAALDTVSLD